MVGRWARTRRSAASRAHWKLLSSPLAKRSSHTGTSVTLAVAPARSSHSPITCSGSQVGQQGRRMAGSGSRGWQTCVLPNPVELCPKGKAVPGLVCSLWPGAGGSESHGGVPHTALLLP